LTTETPIDSKNEKAQKQGKHYPSHEMLLDNTAPLSEAFSSEDFEVKVISWKDFM
jgi:hypothetical protein